MGHRGLASDLPPPSSHPDLPQLSRGSNPYLSLLQSCLQTSLFLQQGWTSCLRGWQTSLGRERWVIEAAEPCGVQHREKTTQPQPEWFCANESSHGKERAQGGGVEDTHSDTGWLVWGHRVSKASQSVNEPGPRSTAGAAPEQATYPLNSQ